MLVGLPGTGVRFMELGTSFIWLDLNIFEMTSYTVNLKCFPWRFILPPLTKTGGDKLNHERHLLGNDLYSI